MYVDTYLCIRMVTILLPKHTIYELFKHSPLVSKATIMTKMLARVTSNLLEKIAPNNKPTQKSVEFPLEKL